MTYFAYSMTFANVGVCIYFLIQLSGNDFFRYTVYYGAPSSTLGNPNFVSGFVGFASIASWILVVKKRTKANFVSSIAMTVLSLFVVIKSDSIQGLFAFVGSIAVFALLLLVKKNLKLALGAVLLSIPAVAIVFLGLVGSGPLANRLATTSLLSRFDYWRAAIAMTQESPFFGKGLDSFGDYYRQFRDSIAFNRFGESQVADSAHNVFLDLFSGGGTPLGLTYILIQFIPANLLTRKIIKSEKADVRELLILSIWIGFTLQSLVSINQIGVGIWGWILAGLMFSRAKVEIDCSTKQLRTPSWVKVGACGLLVPLALVISIAPLRADAKFLSAANSADGLKLKEVSLHWPWDSKRVLLTSAGFTSAGYDQIALDVAKAGVRHNPHSYRLWKQIYDNKNASPELRLQAEQALKSLEPRFVKTP